MDSLFILIPIAFMFTAIAVGTFFWAVNNKQYDDLDSAGESILFEEPTDSELSAAFQREAADE